MQMVDMPYVRDKIHRVTSLPFYRKAATLPFILQKTMKIASSNNSSVGEHYAYLSLWLLQK